jgi:2-polyprenyl-3-methyl-5-hydroxy-6-metoxy-1,4-benzoquinol methylase
MSKYYWTCRPIEYRVVRKIPMKQSFAEMQESTQAHYAVLSPYIEELFGAEDESLSQATLAGICRTVPTGAYILDYGCGTGSLGLSLITKGYRLDFYDPVKENLELLKMKFQTSLGHRIISSESDLRGPYSAIVLKEVLYHVLDSAERIALLRRLRRLLEPAGSVLIAQPFLTEHLYQNPPEYQLVMQSTRSNLKVWLRRKLLPDQQVAATILRLEVQGGNRIEVPAAYFATYDYQQLLQELSGAGLVQRQAIDVETGGLSEVVQPNRMYLLFLGVSTK